MHVGEVHIRGKGVRLVQSRPASWLCKMGFNCDRQNCEGILVIGVIEG